MTDPTRRFSSRVENYSGYRPGYPAEMIAAVRAGCRLTDTAVIADIGAGTGLLTELFLRHGHQVLAVEPGRGPTRRSTRGDEQAPSTLAFMEAGV